jgi:hypothetical protein
MVTQVIKTIGNTGCDYTSLLSAFTALNTAVSGNMVTADQQWTLRVKKGEIVLAVQQLCPAIVCDATRNVVIEPIPGDGFADDVNHLTNPLAYDPTKGAALLFQLDYDEWIKAPLAYLVIQGLQIKNAYGSANTALNINGIGAIVRGNLIDAASGVGGVAVLAGGNSASVSSTVENNILIVGGNWGGISFDYGVNGQAQFNTIIAKSGASTASAISCSANGQIYPVARNNAIFGFNTPFGNVNTSSSNNATDKATLAGTSNLLSQTQSSCFVSTTDFRTKAGSPLIDAGVAISGVTTDIVGQTRDNPPGIGANKYYAAAADTTVPTMSGTVLSSGVTSSGFTIDWSGTTRSDNVAITGYETSTDGTSFTDRGNVTSYAFTGLASSTSYTRYVRAYDAAGNKSTPALSVVVVTSAPSGDTTVPVLVGSITQGTITSISSQISWPAGSDNVAVTSYEVSKDNGTTYVNVGNVLTYTFTGLTASTAYTQRVRAKDAAGLVSTPALSLSVTTSAVAVGSFTSRPMVNDTNTVLASQAGWTVRINHSTTGALIATKTGLTTSSTGVLTYSDAGCTAGTTYENIYIASNGDKGLQDLVAA